MTMANPQEILLRYLSPGQVLLGRYTLEHPLGAGAYGAIFTAIDQVTTERVAVKALPPSAETQSKTALGRFMREMKIVQTLVHPNIICLYDFGEAEHAVPFMVLEYIEGKTLEQLVHGSPLGFDDGLLVLTQLVLALGAAHAQGVIHRDLKPANVMVQGGAGRLEVKVLDFGMAKILSRLGDETAAPLTREGMAVGTPRYIAPEQARGLEVGPYTDLYAVGLLAYEIFTGERAVKDNTVEGAVRAHVSATPLELPRLEQVPLALRPVLLKLLAKPIAARYQCAEEVLVDLERVRRARGVGGGLAPAPRAVPKAMAPVELSTPAPQAPPSAPPPPPKRYAPQSGLPRLWGWRSVSRGSQYIERVVAPALFFFGFVCLTAILGHLPLTSRVLVGLVPGVGGGGLGWVAWRWVPQAGLARGVIVGSCVSVGLAHVISPERLMANLLFHPLWFLEAWREEAVVAPFYQVCSALIRAWAAGVGPRLV